MQIYWQRGVLLNQKGKFCMTHAPLFCDDVYIGTPWVLSHPGVVLVNKGPVMFCLVTASRLFSFGLVGCVSVSCGQFVCRRVFLYYKCCCNIYVFKTYVYVI